MLSTNFEPLYATHAKADINRQANMYIRETTIADGELVLKLINKGNNKNTARTKNITIPAYNTPLKKLFISSIFIM